MAMRARIDEWVWIRIVRESKDEENIKIEMKFKLLSREKLR
jgi:hypothetical protein